MSNREDGSHSERSFPLVPSLETAEDHFRVVSCISIYPCFLVFEIIRVFTHLCHYEPFCGGLQLTRALPFSFSFFWFVLFELIFKYRLQGPRGWSNLSRISLRVGRNWVIWIKLFSSTTTFRRLSPFGQTNSWPNLQKTKRYFGGLRKTCIASGSYVADRKTITINPVYLRSHRTLLLRDYFSDW